MKTESKQRKNVFGTNLNKLQKEDFHAIHVDVPVEKKSQLTQQNASFHWILIPILLSWGVWNCMISPNVLNLLAALCIGTMISIAFIAGLPNARKVEDSSSIQLQIGNLLPSFNRWFTHLKIQKTTHQDQHTMNSYENLPSRILRSLSNSSSTSENEFDFTIRCSESTIAIDDDFDLYQHDVIENDTSLEVEEWNSDQLNSWMTPPESPRAEILPPVAQIQIQPEEKKIVSEPSVQVKRKRDSSSSPSSNFSTVKRFALTPPPRPVPKSTLCRSPDIRRMLEELERMQEESDALVLAGEAVGLGARCTMNERLRRMNRM